MTPVRLEPAAPRSRVKHSTTEPLRSLGSVVIVYSVYCKIYVYLVAVLDIILFFIYQLKSINLVYIITSKMRFMVYSCDK